MVPRYSKRVSGLLFSLLVYHYRNLMKQRSAFSTNRENKNKIWYQMVLETILNVILHRFGTKVFKKELLVYCLYQFVSYLIERVWYDTTRVLDRRSSATCVVAILVWVKLWKSVKYPKIFNFLGQFFTTFKLSYF